MSCETKVKMTIACLVSTSNAAIISSMTSFSSGIAGFGALSQKRALLTINVE